MKNLKPLPALPTTLPSPMLMPPAPHPPRCARLFGAALRSTPWPFALFSFARLPMAPPRLAPLRLARLRLAPSLLAALVLVPWLLAPTCALAQESVIAQGMEFLNRELAQLRIEADTLGFAAHEVGNERVVKGAPYCADAVHENIQHLADGNRIVRSSTTKLCRDGEGRTRQELDRGGRKQVWLRDPVARETWLLDPERKTARRMSGSSGLATPWPPGSGHDSPAWREYSERLREYAERMREWARGVAERSRAAAPGAPGAGQAPSATPAPLAPTPATPPVPPTPPVAPAPPPAPVFITPGAVASPDPNKHFDVEVHVLRLDDDGKPGTRPLPLPGHAPLPPAVNWFSQGLAPRGAGVATSLGSKEIEGLKVNGERTTWTIEAGKVGNEKPILITRDVWTSPELMLTVMTRDFDPRSLETLYRLTQVKRGEPDPALLKVPADYTPTTRVPTPRVPSAPGTRG